MSLPVQVPNGLITNTLFLNGQAAPHASSLLDIQQSLDRLAEADLNNPGLMLAQLNCHGFNDHGSASPPLPAMGDTLTRWQILACVAAFDLSLLKLYEAHTDAVAIIQEIMHMPVPVNSTWGVWCAEASHAKVVSTPYTSRDIDTSSDVAAASDSGAATETDLYQAGFKRAVSLHGTKAWCSGAANVSHALVSTMDENGERQLVALALKNNKHNNKLTIESGHWHAIGMANSRSVDVVFDGAIAYKVGNVDSYLNRPGFWHGAAGIAACWYGAAAKLASITLQFTKTSSNLNPHTAAHLGAMDVALAAAKAVLHETASYIDLHPRQEAAAQCLRCRLVVETAVEQVLKHSGKALGATAFCRNEHYARMHADLTVFLRQSHAEKDLAKLAETLQESTHWTL